MPFVLKRIDQGGGYVMRPGSRGSYTSDVLKAQRFETRESANANRCPDNEIIQDFNELIRN